VARLSPAKRKLARTKRLNSKLFRQIDAVNRIAVHHFKRANDLEALMQSSALPAPGGESAPLVINPSEPVQE
jgi:hypothetical protein